ncbi:MAG TPA: polysaccharide pyruvyl transferase family protein [Sedimentisphaerales bacterium]|nr:polysaccharide pyruvyl transferase family protein [Sedimentisphaerales bacterium]
MDDVLHILIADHVPIANKGEEAIVRGIEDLLSEGSPVALGLFDDVPEVTVRGNITAFPRDWVFRFEGNFALSGRSRVLMQAWIALQLRAGVYGAMKNLIPPGASKYRQLQDFFERACYVLVGHDGVFCVESCGILHLAKKQGKRAGILGASTGIGGGRLYKAGLYRRAMEESDFCVFREEHSCQSMKHVCRDPDKLKVAPDPAFAMRPAPPEAAREFLERDECYHRARQAGRPIVAVTALEKGRVYAGFRPDLQGQAKQQAHAAYLAAILGALVARYGAFLLFLPHSVEQSGNDIVAARHVVEEMKARPGDYTILEQDCGARLLKSIVGRCDFLVGERTHSLIGAVSMGTPFAAMTNRRDTRTHGIIGHMCRGEQQIIDMDAIGQTEATQAICGLFETRDSIRRSLESVRADLASQIDALSRVVKGTS